MYNVITKNKTLSPQKLAVLDINERGEKNGKKEFLFPFTQPHCFGSVGIAPAMEIKFKFPNILGDVKLYITRKKKPPFKIFKSKPYLFPQQKDYFKSKHLSSVLSF